jgi:hypothetical protein
MIALPCDTECTDNYDRLPQVLRCLPFKRLTTLQPTIQPNPVWPPDCYW